ncbi:MAG: hypothetical protein GY716_02255 [bacterium]|nr:hypothetical protein [bacterium]
MRPESMIVAGGVFAVGFFAFHVMFWKLFRWKTELAKLTSLNRAVVQVLNLALMFCFVIFAYLSLVYPAELLSTSMGRSLVLLIAALWFLRAVEQIVFFSMKSTLSVLFFLVFLLGGTLYAAPLALTSPSAEIDAATLLERSAEAMGGSETLDRVRTIRSVADCVSPRGPYTTELRSTRPDRLEFIQEMDGGGRFHSIVDGDRAWSVGEDGTESDLAPAARSMVQGHDFQLMPIVFAERYAVGEVTGIEEFAGSACRRLTYTDDLGEPAEAFFHADTHLLAGWRIANPMRPGEQVTMRALEWRDVGGVRLPSKIMATDGSGDFVLSFDEIEVNTPVVDER